MSTVPTFIADVHLGKLARLLRLLGFDTVYNNVFNKKAFVTQATSDDRVVLSRDATFGKHQSLRVLLIVSEDPTQQLRQVVDHFQFNYGSFKPFSRCLRCNGLLQHVAKKSVEDGLLPNTRTWYDAFWQCDSCNKVYWKGPHYERMMKVVTSFLSPDNIIFL